MNKFEFRPFQPKIETEKNKGFLDVIKERSKQAWAYAKDSNLKYFIPKGKTAYEVMFMTGLTMGAQAIEAKSIDMQKPEANRENAINYLNEFSEENLYDLSLEKLNNDMWSHIQKMENPDIVAYMQEINGSLDKNIQGGADLEIGELGDIQINSNISHVQREGGTDNIYEESYYDLLEAKKAPEELIVGKGTILQVEGVGHNKDEAIINAMKKLTEQSSVDMKGIQSQIQNETDNKFIQITQISSTNAFENVKIISISEDGQGNWNAQIEAEVGELSDN